LSSGIVLVVELVAAEVASRKVDAEIGFAEQSLETPAGPMMLASCVQPPETNSYPSSLVTSR
jgi:hypothetical protein